MMLTAREVLNRLIQGVYNNLDTPAMHRDLCRVLDLALACLQGDSPDPIEAESCPRLWTGDMCWPAAPLDTTVGQPCPVTKSNGAEQGNVSMHCNATTREWNPEKTYHSCFEDSLLPINQSDYDTYADYNQSGYDAYAADYNQSDYLLNLLSPDSDQSADPHIVQAGWYATLGECVTVGHTLSLTSLVLAIILLTSLRRIHCTRIFVHINLMATFMLRGFVWILHKVAFQDSNSIEEMADRASLQLGKKVFGKYNGSDLPVLLGWRKELCLPFDQSNNYVWCRVYYVMLNYSVTANYYWLLAEGLYLSLLLRAVHAHKTNSKYMKGFLVLGWVLPWLSVLGSVLAKLLDPDENNACWFEDKNSAYWWIIKVPIIVSLVVNFGIFVLVIKVVGSKLKVNQRLRADEMREDYRWRLAKSTLALIPLLGIQYLVTVFFSFVGDKRMNPTAAFVRQAFELSFTSIQGLLVAFIYCFLNGEVQDECKRTWRRWKLRWELRRGHHWREQRRKKASTGTNNTSMTNLYAFYTPRKSSALSTASRPSYCSGKPLNGDLYAGYCSTALNDPPESARLCDVTISRGSSNGSACSRASLSKQPANRNRLSVAMATARYSPVNVIVADPTMKETTIGDVTNDRLSRHVGPPCPERSENSEL